jgi:glycosyltransferase involved in cell wall biosynthesis
MQEKLPLFGFNVVGGTSTNGIGNVLQQCVNALLVRGENVRVLSLNAGSVNNRLDKSLDECFVPSVSELPYAINLLITGVPELSHFALLPSNEFCVNDKLNVAFVWWELEKIPQYLIDAAKVFDVLIAGSDFVYSILSNNITGVPILYAPYLVSIPKGIQSNRKRFKLLEPDFIVFMGFDPLGNIDRKNPFAAIEAFKLAFPDRPDCRLIIKVNCPERKDDSAVLAGLKRLHECIESDPRIYLIEERLTYPDLLCLYASCDVFISLHRTEGLGLIPLEAMHLGKPVVATAWSGNMSYMNYSNACLVEFDFVPIVEADSLHYGFDTLNIETRWAEPNISQAVAWLRKLAEDSQFRLQLGLRAAADANRYHKQASRVDFVDELKAIWESREFLPKRNKESLINQARESKRRFEYERYLRKMSPFDRFVHKTKKELDRHLLWRFRKGEV